MTDKISKNDKERMKKDNNRLEAEVERLKSEIAKNDEKIKQYKNDKEQKDKRSKRSKRSIAHCYPVETTKNPIYLRGPDGNEGSDAATLKQLRAMNLESSAPAIDPETIIQPVHSPLFIFRAAAASMKKAQKDKRSKRSKQSKQSKQSKDTEQVTKIPIYLRGPDGNAFSLLAKVQEELERRGDCAAADALVKSMHNMVYDDVIVKFNEVLGDRYVLVE